jgi:D-glycero-alpha-D-manno-heptose-7-phosphate kinase
MIITKTPFRMSFVGGGSDLKEFYEHFQGAVLSTSINKYMYISSHKFFDEDKIRAKYSQTETVKNVNKLQHPIIKEVLKKFKVKGALEISSNADVPAGAGLGSSSSFTVGLLHNLYTIYGNIVSPRQLAEEACQIEIDKLREPIGKQDQYAVAFGGLNVIKFNTSGSVSIEPIHLRKDIYDMLQKNLLAFYIGSQRNTRDILSEQRRNLLEQDKIDVLRRMVDLVWKLREVLYEGKLDVFGKILHENWLLKCKLASKITNIKVQRIYERALKNGAVGGKLLGAGGGGFLLFYCNPKNQKKLRNAMSGYREMDYKFENEGSKLIYIGDEEYEYRQTD